MTKAIPPGHRTSRKWSVKSWSAASTSAQVQRWTPGLAVTMALRNAVQDMLGWKVVSSTSLDPKHTCPKWCSFPLFCRILVKCLQDSRTEDGTPFLSATSPVVWTSLGSDPTVAREEAHVM